MARTVNDLTPDELGFLAERHLGTLTTVRADGTPHVVTPPHDEPLPAVHPKQ